ncbi:MAG: FtsX-like permease family protein [Bacilli bacterium]|nr:FtsX-like permease family protein [Bacilli bacterium]
MKVLYQFTRSNLKQNKHRTVVTIIGIGLTSILLFCLGFGATIIENQELDNAVRKRGYYHFAYTDVDTIILKELQKKQELSKIEVETELSNFKISWFRVKLYGRDSYELGNMKLQVGEYPKKEGEILLSYPIAHIYKKKIGDILEIDGKNYQIAGIYDCDSSYAEQNIYTWRNTFEQDNLTIYMTLKNPKNGYEKIHELSKSLGFQSVSLTRIEDYEHENINHNMLKTYGEYRDYLDYATKILVLMILSTVLSIVCILVIYNAFAISVTERKKTLGVLSSIGATPMQLLKSVMYEATIIAFIAIPLGFAIASIGSYLFVFLGNHFFMEILSTPLRFGLNPIYFIMCLIFILISIYLSAFFPAMRAREVTPLEAIRMSQDIKLKKKKIKRNRFIHLLFGIEGDIAYKNRKRNKKKYRIVTLSLVIGIVLFMLFATFFDLQKKIFDKNSLPETTNFVSISLVGEEKEQEEYLKRLLEQVNIIEQEKIKNTIAAIDDNVSYHEDYLTKIVHPSGSIRLMSLNEGEYEKYAKKIGLKEKKPILLNHISMFKLDDTGKQQLVLDTDVFKPMNSFHFTLNDEVRIVLDDFMMTTTYMEDTLNTYIPILYVPDEMYQEWIKKSNNIDFVNDSLSTAYHIKTVDYRTIEKNYQKLKSSGNILASHYNNESYEVYKGFLTLKMWNFLVIGAVCFIAIIAITSVVNTIHTSMQLRKKEFAILRSIGMTPKSFYKMICLESIFFGIWSLIFGLLISTGCIKLLFGAMNVGVLPKDKIQYEYPFTYMWITIIAVFIIVLISMIYSSKKASKENIVDILKEDSF